MERLQFFHRYLEHTEPLLASAAHEEIARAPYAAMKSLKPALDRSRLWAWVDDGRRVDRHALYYLLIGLAGHPSDSQRIQERIEAAWKTSRVQTLAAMLVADLELGGEPRVGYIEKAYILDPHRTLGEIESALLAFSVHGNESSPIARARVVRAYRLMIEHRAPLAGFVAADLAAWEYWDAGLDLLAILRSGKLHPAARFAIVNYLKASPRPEAQAGLREIFADRPRPVFKPVP